MIKNYICKKCEHILVCKKQADLKKFAEESNNIGIDITIDNCHDFLPLVKEV